MATHYVYLPVYDLELANVANGWKRDAKQYSNKDYEIIIRQATGLSKWYSRKKEGGILRNIPATATVYVLAHGFSAGRTITGTEAQARALLSLYGENYPYLKKRYAQACEDCEKNGLVNLEKGDDALEDALEDNQKYQQVVNFFAAQIKPDGKTAITLERPGALRIGGTRPNGTTKIYSPTEFFNHLRKEELPRVPKLKIFACNTGITARGETQCFAEQLYEAMKTDYPTTRVFGYLGAVTASYSYQRPPHGDGEVPDNSSEIWGQFHKSGAGGFTEGRHKGVRMVKPSEREVVMWGSSNQEQIPAHVLRVEFPGGKSVSGDMLMQENESKPF